VVQKEFSSEHAHTIFIGNLPSNVSIVLLKNEFACFVYVLDVHIPNQVAKRSL